MIQFPDLLNRAIHLAVDAHEGQTDKQGRPYVLHVLAVATGLEKAAGDDARIVALLHDVLEDAPAYGGALQQLLAEVPDDEVRRRMRDALALLTRSNPNEPYTDYVRRIAESGNPVAVLVKRSDLAHNLSRLADVEDEEMRRRLEAKYAPAVRLLEIGAGRPRPR